MEKTESAVRSRLLEAGKGMRGSAGDCKEFFLFGRRGDAVGHDPGQVCSCGGVNVCLTVRGSGDSIQSVWCDEEGIITADFPGFPVHHICKFPGASGNVLGDDDSRIIVGFQHQGIKQIL